MVNWLTSVFGTITNEKNRTANLIYIRTSLSSLFQMLRVGITNLTERGSANVKNVLFLHVFFIVTKVI